MNFKYLWCVVLCSLVLPSLVSAQLKARVFKDHCYSGSSQNLYNFSYKKSQLTVGNDKISSIVVYPGWAVDLYEDDNYQGDCYTVTANMNDLKSVDFGDEVSSLKIRSISYPGVNYSTEKVLPNQFANSTELTKTLDKPMYLNKSLHPLLPATNRIHSQGLGWDNLTGNFVYTGCRASTTGCIGESYLVLYKPDLHIAVDAVVSAKYNGNGRGKSHPSAIQIMNGKFPVAIARDKYETSYIEFYKVNSNSLQYLPGNDISYHRHLGAVAYANINGNTYIVAGGWDSDFLVVWKASGINRTNGFLYQKTIYPTSSVIQDCGVDDNWGKYNSLWLGKMKNGRIVLMASHGNLGFTGGWVDLWDVNSLDKYTATKMTKFHKSKTTNGIGRSHFYEGTTFGPNNRVYSAPHDFGNLFGSWMNAKSVYAHRYTYRSCTYGGGVNSFSADQPDIPTPFINLEDRTPSEIANPLTKETISSAKPELSFSPNPFQDIVNLKQVNFDATNTEALLQITSLSGKVVRKVRLTDFAEQDRLAIDLNDLEAGVYFFTVITKEHTITKKLIKFNP
ncbi:MAG: T9SS type A sorting domain-containing protein [Saprospiraceae bacterium]